MAELSPSGRQGINAELQQGARAVRGSGGALGGAGLLLGLGMLLGGAFRLFFLGGRRRDRDERERVSVRS